MLLDWKLQTHESRGLSTLSSGGPCHLGGSRSKVVVADYESEPLEGEPQSVSVVLRFDSKSAARAWYNSPEYQEIVSLRTNNTE